MCLPCFLSCSVLFFSCVYFSVVSFHKRDCLKSANALSKKIMMTYMLICFSSDWWMNLLIYTFKNFKPVLCVGFFKVHVYFLSVVCVCLYFYVSFGGVHFFVLWSHGNLTSGRGLCGCGYGTWKSEFCRSFNWYTTSVRSVRAAQYQFYFCHGFMDVLWTVALQLNMLTWKPPCFGWVTGSHVHIIVLLGRQG